MGEAPYCMRAAGSAARGACSAVKELVQQGFRHPGLLYFAARSFRGPWKPMPTLIRRSLGILLLIATITVPSCAAFFNDPGPLIPQTTIESDG